MNFNAAGLNSNCDVISFINQRLVYFLRFPRHFKANDIIKRAVALAGFPVKIEPSGLSKDGTKKCPDGYTYDSFKAG
jgi:hypothetical protein